MMGTDCGSLLREDGSGVKGRKKPVVEIQDGTGHEPEVKLIACGPDCNT